MKLAISLLFTLLTSSSFAQLTKTKILHITVDISQSYGEVYMYNNEDGDIDHFEWQLHHTDEPAESDTFSVDDIRKGTVFKKGIPKKFVTVIGDNFSEVYGGEISMKYPENAITGRYNTETFEVDRETDSTEERWAINHRTKKDFKRVHVIVNKFLGAPIGAYQVKFID